MQFLVKHTQSRNLRSREPAEEQDATGLQGATECRRQGAQWRFQDIGHDEVKRSTLIGSRVTEMDINRVRIQVRVRPGTAQRLGIDVGTDDPARATSPGNPGEHAGTRSYIQNPLRLPLPTKQVHGGGTQARGRVRAVTEYGRTIRPRSKLGQPQPALGQYRRHRAERIHDDPRGNVMDVAHNIE